MTSLTMPLVFSIRQIIVMLVVILVVFIFCWLPQMASLLYSEYRRDKNNKVSIFSLFIMVVHQVMHHDSVVLMKVVIGKNC